MKRKIICKISIDVAMTILLLLLMAKQLTGDAVHEWLGAGMFVLWAVHHLLNLSWHRHIHKGTYTPLRILQLAINILLLFSMLGMMVSGLILSREVFAFLPISGGLALARPLHIVSAFWGFVLMALHLGLHWNMILGMVRRMTGPISSKPARIALRTAGGAVAAYGLYGFLKNQFPSYLLLTSSFVFFDFERPAALFFTEYFAIMGLFVFLAHYGAKALQKPGRQKKAAEKP